ncbi:MAG: hypothetical protein Q9170_006868 [Blastenia crenularia]
MAILKDVEVRVVSKTSGQPLEEYEQPGTTSGFSDLSVERYIEAKTGEGFQVEVFVKEEFDCYAAWGIKVAINIDGGVVMFRRDYDKGSVQRHQNSRKPIVFNSVRYKDGSQHREAGFRFGSLRLSKFSSMESRLQMIDSGSDEDLEVVPDILESQKASLGLIKITVERVNRSRKRTPTVKRSFYNPLTTLEVPKELLKDGRVDSVMK